MPNMVAVLKGVQLSVDASGGFDVIFMFNPGHGGMIPTDTYFRGFSFHLSAPRWFSIAQGLLSKGRAAATRWSFLNQSSMPFSRSRHFAKDSTGSTEVWAWNGRRVHFLGWLFPLHYSLYSYLATSRAFGFHRSLDYLGISPSNLWQSGYEFDATLVPETTDHPLELGSLW